MRMYPSYKLDDVLNQYAVTFFTLLQEGYKAKNRNHLMLINLISVSVSNDAASSKFIKDLEWAAQDAGDILSSSSEGSSPAEIKKMLQG